MLTDDEIAERLRRAAAAVDDAGLAADLRRTGFERALDALDLRAVAVAPAASTATTQTPGPGRVSTSDAAASPDGAFAPIAERFELSLDQIERIYTLDDGQIRLAIKRSMLPEPDSKAASMRDVSLLIASGRQAAGAEDETSFALMREECQALGVLDGPNFATEVGKLDFRLKGGRNTRTVKANRHHFEEAAQLITRMLSRSES